MSTPAEVRAARRQIAADVPEDLAEADDLLSKFGRWAMDRRRTHRCASAEGQYQAPPNDDDRVPREVMLPAADAALINRALQAVPDRERVVLHVLYIPKRQPPAMQLRLFKIKPEAARQRHADGLRHFWHTYLVLLEADLEAQARRARRLGLVSTAFEVLLAGAASPAAD